jgi:phospholipase/lecithinase/hemolysin
LAFEIIKAIDADAFAVTFVEEIRNHLSKVLRRDKDTDKYNQTLKEAIVEAVTKFKNEGVQLPQQLEQKLEVVGSNPELLSTPAINKDVFLSLRRANT